MPKLRKMLGRADMPVCRDVIRLLDTQSHQTLAVWAIRYAQETCLPVYKAHGTRFSELLERVRACEHCAVEGAKVAAVKPQLRELAGLAREEPDPIAQAAAKAIATACAALQTPTNALGFLFYAAAAEVYQALGTNQTATVYDKAAETFFAKALASLQTAAVEGDPNPIHVNWNC